MENFTIDRENKSFVFDDGEVIPIPKDKQKQVLRSKAAQGSKQEAIEKWKNWEETVPIGETGHALVGSTSESLFGNLGDTLANYVVSGVKSFKTGEGQEGMGYIDRVLDHFYAMQEGRKEYLSGLQQKSPTASKVGTGLGIAGELGTLYGVPGYLALPAMGAGASETSFLEPVEKSKEVGKEAITGAVLDKFFGGLSKIAGHRQTQRGLKNLIAETEERNLGEIQRAAQATEADKLRYANQLTSREGELQKLAKLQQAENKAFQKATDTSIGRIAKTMGKQNLSAEMLGVEDFIDQAINQSAHAATSEANYASKFLRSVFKGDKSGKITGEGLKRGMRALDEAILKSEGAAQNILMEYKDFVSKTLPEKLASSYVYEKWAPKILQRGEGLEKNLSKIFPASGPVQENLVRRLGADYVKNLNTGVKQAVKDVLEKYKHDFVNVDRALIKDELMAAIQGSPPYQKIMKQVDSFFPQLGKEAAHKAFPELATIESSLLRYPEMVSERVAKAVDRYLPDIGLDFTTKMGISDTALQKAPITPNVLPQPPAVPPARTIQPNLQQVPQIPEPQGMYEKLASGLESFRSMGAPEIAKTAKENLPVALGAKLMGIPFGKMVATGAGVAGAARGLTSPSAAGQLLRTGLEQGARGAVAVIDELAKKYPSYHDGIVEDPQERRSLTKEIENMQDVPIEQKAIFQSKINRGKPLYERLH